MSTVAIKEYLASVNKVILGKHQQVQLALCGLLSNGHLLIEDVPGVGKTTLVKALAKALGLTTNRIQFTNDLLPADILGTSIFDEQQKKFVFHPGPIFAQVVIADELNRATPKTQSAFLQAMEERQVTIDGVTHVLPDPFFVVATQNPQERSGTYALPESQLDRFFMRLELGYPDRQAERELLLHGSRTANINELAPALTLPEFKNLQRQVQQMITSEALVTYVQDLLEASRALKGVHQGLSPRAGLALVRAAKAWAFIEGRKLVLPEDVQAVAASVMGHRLGFTESSSNNGHDSVQELLATVKVA